MMTADVPDLRAFQRIVFFTGAGLSAESGIPTFRGEGGIWSTYRYEDYACQRAFERDPGKVWDFHDMRRKVASAAEPCLSHRIVAAVEAERPGTTIVTQNIDGLHQRAGSHCVVELHGSLWRVRCHCPPGVHPNLESPIEDRRCPGCGAWRRPDIVWFEDPMPSGPIEAAIDAIASCDLLVSIGTSGVVYPAAELPRLARDAGATLVEVNPQETPVSDWFQHHLRGPGSEMLARLWPRHATA
jgi:NAD-dependent deacetylase